MKKIKVAILIPSLSIGGAEMMACQLAANINKELFDVLLIVIYDRFNNSLQDYVDEHIDNVIHLGKGNGLSFNALHKMTKTLRKFKPNIIHTNIQSFVYAIPYLLCHRVKVLHTMHNIPEKESKKSGRRLLKVLFKLNKAIPIGISDTISLETKKYYNIKKCPTVYNPVDINKFSIQKKEANSCNKFIFINIGRVVEQKNQLMLIDAFSKIEVEFPNVILQIAGKGHLLESLEKKIHDYGLKNIELLGERADIPYLLSQADVFVLSSIFEGLPMTILEAMAMGLPIISTDVGGCKDIVKDNGILVNNQDCFGLYEAMKSMIINKEKRLSMGEKSLQYSKRYSIENVSAQYEELFKTYCNLKRGLD